MYYYMYQNCDEKEIETLYYCIICGCFFDENGNQIECKKYFNYNIENKICNNHMEEKFIDKAFVKSFKENEVVLYFFKLNQCRKYTADFMGSMFFFKGMKLFKGKNVWFETIVKPGTMTEKCFESKQSKLKQLFNYYFLKKF